MNDLPIKKASGEIEKKTDGSIQPVLPDMFGFPFFTFRYSEKSVTSSGTQTHIKARELNYKNGKIEEKAFEGNMEGNYFESIEKGLQNQAELMLNSFKLFFPF